MAEELEHEPQPQEPRTELPEEGAAPADGAEPEKKEKKPSEDLFYWLNALTTALVSLVLVFTFIGRLTRVQGESMTNTLQDQQLLLVAFQLHEHLCRLLLRQQTEQQGQRLFIVQIVRQNGNVRRLHGEQEVPQLRISFSVHQILNLFHQFPAIFQLKHSVTSFPGAARYFRSMADGKIKDSAARSRYGEVLPLDAPRSAERASHRSSFSFTGR